jgi:hypothetical protein
MKNFLKNSYCGKRVYYNFNKALKWSEYFNRKEIAQKLIEDHKPSNTLTNQGYAITDYIEKQQL